MNAEQYKAWREREKLIASKVADPVPEPDPYDELEKYPILPPRLRAEADRRKVVSGAPEAAEAPENKD